MALGRSPSGGGDALPSHGRSGEHAADDATTKECGKKLAPTQRLLATVATATDNPAATMPSSVGGGHAAPASIAEACDRVVMAATEPVGSMTQHDRIDLMSALEDLKNAACALQAEVAVHVLTTEVTLAEVVADEAVDEDAPAQVRAQARERRKSRARRSATAQIALARRESPHRAGVLVGAAEALVREMPCTLAALRSGALNEHRAVLLVRETACLDEDARREVDQAVCGDPRELAGTGTRRLVAAARKHAYRLDPSSFVRRAERSAAERNVTLRPAPGAMTYLTALLPMAQGVGVLANLRRAAETARATGDGRAMGQVMADTLVERLTGQPTADAVPVAVSLIMSDATLLAAGHEPAMLDGGHPVPAQLARELVARAMDLRHDTDAPPGGEPGSLDRLTERASTCEQAEAEVEADGHRDSEITFKPGSTSVGRHRHPEPHQESGGTRDTRETADRLGAWVRRLYADAGGDLVAVDSRSRTFPAGLARLLRVRDQGLCRTPWCDAPVAHTDHITPYVDGGATTAGNGQGLCAGCNYTKQAPRWIQSTDTRHSVSTTTPTGHSYRSTAPVTPTPLELGRRGSAPTISTRPETDTGTETETESVVEAAFRAIIEVSYAEPAPVAAALRAARRASSTPGDVAAGCAAAYDEGHDTKG